MHFHQYQREPFLPIQRNSMIPVQIKLEEQKYLLISLCKCDMLTITKEN